MYPFAGRLRNMAMTIIAIGKKHEAWIKDGLEEYEQRLRKPFEAEWRLLPHSPIAERAIADESERILESIQPDDYVVLLDEKGKMLSSPELSQALQAQFNWGQRVVFIIGGAFGVSQSVKDRADLVWSLSDLVFPHQLVRLILIEQIYRAQTIANGEAYHHV